MLKTCFSAGLRLVLATGLLASSPAFAGVCGNPGTPATTVPQFRSEIPGQSIWPLDAFGNVVFKPASTVPSNRDSTNYITQTIPGNGSGHELFQDVAVLDDNPDWLFVAYNAGLQVWDLRSNPASPTRELYKDGWQGHFEIFPTPGEGDTYIESIDAISAPTGSNVFIVLGGRSGHGMSVWRFNTVTESITQIFQESGVFFRDVRLINHSNGRTYALGSDADASTGGVHVYDITTANTTPCFDSNGGPSGCPSYEGKIGTMNDGAYVDTLTVGSDTYIVASDGSGKATDPLKVEIWLLSNPESPEAVPTGGSVRKFQGLVSNSRGVQLFEMGSKQFLAMIEVVSASNTILRIYDVSQCLDSDGCTSVGSPKFSYSLPSITGNFQYLTVSKSGDQTFVYYGLETTPLHGDRVEQLFDVSSLATLSPAVVEITDAGASYTDPCSGDSIDYWGDYYGNNAYGLDNLLPRHGRFQGKYFYRAAVGVLDIHELAQSDPQASISTTTSSNLRWMGDPVSFGTVLGGECLPVAGLWCWLVEIAPAPGDSVNYAPLPTNLISGCDTSFSSPQAFTFSCDEAGRCGDATVGVTAWNLGCGDFLDGTQSEATLTVQDPTVLVDANGTTSIQECQTSPLVGSLVGRGPANWRWEVDGVPVEGCSGSVATATDLADAGSQSCSWTANQFDDLFADGFEIGNCSAWSTASPSSCAPTLTQPKVVPKRAQSQSGAQKGLAGATATFLAWDPALGPETPFDSADVNISVSPIGDPTWVKPGTPVTVVVSGNQATFSAPANDSGTWTWELEDPAGASSCTLPGVGTVSCEIRTTTSGTTQKAWSNADTYAYRVTASNCRSATTVVSSGDVTILPGIQPNIVSFDLDSNAGSVCCGSLLFGDLRCVAGQPVKVRVDVSKTDPTFQFAFALTRAANGPASSATFGSPVTPSSTSGNSYFFNVVFNSTGVRWPVAKASSGSLADYHELLAGASGESSISLEIVSAGGCP